MKFTSIRQYFTQRSVLTAILHERSYNLSRRILGSSKRTADILLSVIKTHCFPVAWQEEHRWHTVTVTVCQRIPQAGKKIDRQPEVRPSEEERDNGSFYFSTTHSSGRKELACPPAVWTWGRLVHRVWVTGLPRAIVTVHLSGVTPH